MALLTINGFPVLTVAIVLPSYGAWHADVTADSPEPLPAAVTMTDEVATFEATVRRGGVFHGRASARIVGGKDGLGGELGAKGYRAVPVRTVLADIMTASGETLSADSTDLTLGNFVTHWQRVRGSAGSALSLLTDHIDRLWRVQNDGTIFVGADTFPVLEIEQEIISEDPRLGTMTIAPQSFNLIPGVTFEGRKVSRVHHMLTPGNRRSEVWFDD